MTGQELLASLRARGVSVRAAAGRLQYDGELTDQEVEELRARKAELLELLDAEGRPRPARVVRRTVQRPAEPEPEPPPAPRGEWVQPDPVRSAAAQARARDVGGRFQPSEAVQAERRCVEARELLERLRAAGVVLRAQGDRLRQTDGPPLAPEARERVANLKAELLPLLPTQGWVDGLLFGGDDVA